MAEQQNERITKAVEQERGRLFNFIRKQVKDAEDAEDILQDVLFRFTTSFRDLNAIQDTTAWLFRVARNRIIDWYRKMRPETFSSQAKSRPESDDDNPLMLEDILRDMSMAPETMYDRSMIWDAVEAALDELPEAQRDVFIMHEFEDMSFREIAELTGDPVNTLLSRKRYAVLHLREVLRELYDEINYQ